MLVTEVFGYRPFAANGAALLVGSGGGTIGGFLCVTSGSLKLTEGVGGAGATVTDTMAVTAGTFYPLPFAIPPGTFLFATLTGGAAGTFAAL